MPMALASPDAEPGDQDEGDGGDVETIVRAAASTVETLRHKDVTTLGAAERAELDRALAALALPGQSRPSRRRRPSPHPGPVDPRRTVRALLRSGGEPVRPKWTRRSVRPRPVVLLVDVSGSMSGYADVLLRFAHAATRRRGARTEVFTLGTRLTRVTREMATPDPERAMAAVSGAVPDFSGGTRLGVLLREFLDRWGQRGAARGAVVVILSDGWERDDPAVLGARITALVVGPPGGVVQPAQGPAGVRPAGRRADRRAAVRGRLRRRAQPGGTGTAGRSGGRERGAQCVTSSDRCGPGTTRAARSRWPPSSARPRAHPGPGRGDGGRARRRGGQQRVRRLRRGRGLRAGPGRARRRAAGTCRPTATPTPTRSPSA